MESIARTEAADVEKETGDIMVWIHNQEKRSQAKGLTLIIPAQEGAKIISLGSFSILTSAGFLTWSTLLTLCNLNIFSYKRIFFEGSPTF